MELYVTNPHARQVKSDPALQELSETLRGLDLGLPRPDAAEFRNLNGCYMKLQNFKAIDPAYPGKGLRRGVTKRMEGLWARFAEDTEALREAASTIRADKGQVLRSQDIAADPEDEAVLEGKVLYLIHRIRERRRGPEKKKRVLSETGRLECEVCGFDFRRTYGYRRAGFAECHHKLPLNAGERQTRLSDLAIVCSNCHRMLHRGHNLSVEELRIQLTGGHRRREEGT